MSGSGVQQGVECNRVLATPGSWVCGGRTRLLYKGPGRRHRFYLSVSSCGRVWLPGARTRPATMDDVYKAAVSRTTCTTWLCVSPAQLASGSGGTIKQHLKVQIDRPDPGLWCVPLEKLGQRDIRLFVASLRCGVQSPWLVHLSVFVKVQCCYSVLQWITVQHSFINDTDFSVSETFKGWNTVAD